jgi:hypothetical protein
MKTVTYTKDLYEFKELSDKAKQYAISNQSLDYEWWDCCHDMWKEKLTELGFYDVEISSSGFYSQGDGASFTGRVDVVKWIKANEPVKYRRLVNLFEKSFIELECNKIKRDRNTHYVHWNTTSVYLDFIVYSRKDDSNICDLLDQLEADILDRHQLLNNDIYKSLEKEYDYLMSEEAFSESADANGWFFDVDGKMTN